METAIFGLFFAAYWVLGDLFEPDMCYTEIHAEPAVWQWVECEEIDLSAVEVDN